MYAVIETGGKQYRVEVGTELEVELLDAEPGEAITIQRVLLVADGDEASIGRPLVANAAVHAEVIRRDRGEKLIVFKYRPKARSRVKKGHRQDHTVLRVTDVRLGSKSAAESVRKAELSARTERERLEEAAARQAAADAALAAKLAAASGSKAKAEPKGKADSKASAQSRGKADSKAGPESKAKAGAKPGKSKASARSEPAKASGKGTPARPAAKGKAAKPGPRKGK
jgi:large subunit ribosomal protein L21